MMKEQTIKIYKAKDGATFNVNREGDRYFIYAKFPKSTKVDNYTNNFVGYIDTEITDEATAIGIASFAYDCYERRDSENGCL